MKSKRDENPAANLSSQLFSKRILRRGPSATPFFWKAPRKTQGVFHAILRQAPYNESEQK